MPTLYLWLDIGVLFFPFVLSFDKKVGYVQDWKEVFLAMLVVATLFLIHDYYFTQMGVWGFNPTYLTGYYVLNLPIEEVLFFVVVPFACLFIYQCCRAYLKQLSLQTFNQFFYVVITLYALWVLAAGFGKWYSTMVAILAIILLAWLVIKQQKFPYLPITIVISFLPFFIMNSVLTGAFTVEPIVWYNNSENLGIRWGTIPAEDMLYSFLMITGNIVLFEKIAVRRLDNGKNQGA